MKSFCSYFNAKTCQSCRLIEVDYQEQLRLKEDRLREALADLPSWKLLPSIASRSQGFRNKAKLSVTGSLESPVLGLSGENDLDRGREILNCPVHHPVINEHLKMLPDFIRLAKLVPYNISAKAGELKGIIIYHSEDSAESYLRFILRSKESIDRIKKHLTSLLDRFACVSVNIQPIPHAILEGDEEIILTERSFIRHSLGKVEFRLGPKGFVQTNQAVAQKLYQTAAGWAHELKTKKFAELFCGQGAFSFFIAPYVGESVGFEINPNAVAEANRTVQELGMRNMSFKAADAAQVEAELKAFSPDLLLLNPPRRGLGSSLGILQRTPWPHLIYSSCSLESLAQDLKALEHLYEVKVAQIFDMFPHTEHFETLILLGPRSSSSS